MIKIEDVWGLDFDRLLTGLENNIKNIDGIILDFLCEIRYCFDHPSYFKILDIAHKNKIPVTILTPYLKQMPPLMDFDLPEYKDINVIHWETFWFARTYNIWRVHEIYNKGKNIDMYNMRNAEYQTDFKYPFITLNNISKNHRCLVMDLLSKYNLIDKGAVSWRDIRRDCDNIRHTFPENVTDSAYRKYPYKYWTPKRMILDQKIEDRFLQETMPIEFNSSFMQLVTESDDELIFYSEKTCTPLLLNKLFLIAGAVDMHKCLKKYGFSLYDEIFDYSFDSEKDINLRYEGLVENIKKISSYSENELSKIYKKIYDKIAFNKQVAISHSNNILVEIKNILQILKEKNTDPYSGPLNMFL